MVHVLNLTQNQTSSLTTPSLPVEWLKKKIWEESEFLEEDLKCF